MTPEQKKKNAEAKKANGGNCVQVSVRAVSNEVLEDASLEGTDEEPSPKTTPKPKPQSSFKKAQVHEPRSSKTSGGFPIGAGATKQKNKRYLKYCDVCRCEGRELCI